MKIYIAAGHGGQDPGAIANGTTEREIVEALVNQAVPKLREILKDQAEIIQVPNGLNVNDTASWINLQDKGEKDSVCIEFHMNSNVGQPGTGTETYFGNPSIAAIIHQELLKTLALRDRGIKNGNSLKFNKSTSPSSCLVELGFINNTGDLEKVKLSGVDAIINAICKLVSGNNQATQVKKEEHQKLLREIKQKLIAEQDHLEKIIRSIN